MNKFVLGLTGCAALFLAANAGAALKLDIGGTTYTDGGANDAGVANDEIITLLDLSINPLTGIDVPGFTGSITVGKGDLASDFPELMSLNFNMSTDATKSAGDTLKVMLTDTDVGYSLTNLVLSSSVNSDIKVEYDLWIGAAGNEFDLGTKVASTKVGTVPDKDLDVGYLAAPTSDPFSMTMVATIYFDGGSGDVINGATLARVPEPQVIALFGLGMLGLGLARRRVRK